MARQIYSYAVLLIVFSLTIATSMAQNELAVLMPIKKQPVEVREPTELPKRLVRKFKRDAARLALRLDASQEDLRYQNIYIPKDNVESIYDVLSKIYLEDDLAQSLAQCNVHTFPNPSIDHFKIIFTSDIEWAEPLRMGVTETDSRAINDLLDEYDLVLENHEKWTDTEDVIIVRSKEPMNMAALANEFYNIEGVVEIDLGIPEVEGNDIKIERQPSGWKVEYILKFGASFVPGEGKQHVWTYLVADNGEVQFVEEGGDAIPSYMKCSAAKRMATEK